MKYSLTLTTDEYTLTGEVYEREDGKGYEYRLKYSTRDEAYGNMTVPKVWDRARDEGLPTWITTGILTREEAQYELRKRFAFAESTLTLFS